MKPFLTALSLCLLSVPAMADVVYVPQDGDRVRELPGNATVVTNSRSGGGNVVIYNGDESLIYRSIVGPYNYNRRDNIPNTAPIADVNAFCANAKNNRERNECREDVIKEREKLYDKYN